MSSSTIESRLRACGLLLVERPAACPTSPTPREAFHLAVGFTTSPSERIPKRSPDAVERTTQAWLSHARSTGVIAEDDDTLLVAAAIDGPWLRVRLPRPAFSLAPLADPQGDIELTTRSHSGDRVCAISTDDGEYWIISEPCPPEDPWA
ncbi:hypothetical protein [Streptomyces xanthii]|uniref:Uncharacterized protein n=1 Tax=Streptomyces xanthii TaxID=2768069 RepID=A0A7H1B8K8_9ACTN|nr:hypothetical protein [Streptomyces xanthii]QNS05063.1 hypothetical protein IAG42_16555 [Streptomyces xanthii]